MYISIVKSRPFQWRRGKLACWRAGQPADWLLAPRESSDVDDDVALAAAAAAADDDDDNDAGVAC